MNKLADQIPQILQIARRAGGAVMEVYSSGDFGESVKKDNSPLTIADLRSNDIIISGLNKIAPRIPVLSEESKQAPYEKRKSWQKFWMVDPLDGTKEFLNRRSEFTVNIALIENGAPAMGVVYAPALKTVYYAAKGEGAFKRVDDGEPVNVKACDYRDGGLKVIASRLHGSLELKDFLRKIGPHEVVTFGSSLKFCVVAEGSAHLYPRLAPTMEWDTAAAQIIVEEAGGAVTDFNGEPLRYNKENLLNPFFIVTGNPPFPWKELTDGHSG